MGGSTEPEGPVSADDDDVGGDSADFDEVFKPMASKTVESKSAPKPTLKIPNSSTKSKS